MDPSFVRDTLMEATETTSNIKLEDKNDSGLPKGNSQNNINLKKPGRFRGLRFSFRKRKKNVELADETLSPLDELKKTKKSKQDKNDDNKKKKNEVSSPEFDKASSLGRRASLPEEHLPSLKRQISKSKIGSTLVRKFSFGKIKVANRSRVTPETSPTISNVDLNSALSSSYTGSSSHHGHDGNVTTPNFSSGENRSAIRSIIAQLDSLSSEYDVSQSEPSSFGWREGLNQSASNKDLQPTHMKDIAGEYDLEKDFQKPFKSCDVSSCFPLPVIDHGYTKLSDKTDLHFEVNKNAHETSTALKRIAVSSTFVGLPREPVGSVENILAVSAKLDRETVVPESAIITTPKGIYKSTFAENTFKVRSAWMSVDMNKEQDEKQKKIGVSKKSTKSQILSITTPMWEKEKLEDATKEIIQQADEIVSTISEFRDDIDEEQPVTPSNVDTSVAGSSKSDVYFTPSDSPSPTRMSSDVVDKDEDDDDENLVTSANTTAFFTPEARYIDDVVSEVESVVTEEISSLHSGEDIMAEARAKLSQSLGIGSSLASQTQVGDKREHLYKILVIGELGTGKTSIIKRYVHQFFSQHYRATIGVDFALKVLNWDANTIIRLQLWDIAGQERFGNMTRVYYKEAVGAFIVFDVTRAATFDAVVKWKQDLDSKVQLPDGSSIPCVLLANKCDQQKEGLVNNPGKMDEYCKERGFSGWFETSAKENINIEEAARSLVTKILQNDQLRNQSDSSRDGDKFNLDGTNAQDEKSKSKCSC